ncbi:MAG: AmmeMemoRadiSam system protein A [Epsilonproteobacteria bacterium]|nr:MAG: AmmeMemoRadiSam system protein A [Campylobacterota bacterium]
MGEVFIQLAKAAIAVSLGLDSNFDLQKARVAYPQLEQNSATFITITKGKQRELRGCIGSLVAHRPLYKDIIYNAQLAALKDSRFNPLTIDEFQNIKIEISILTTPKPISYNSINELKAKVRPQIDGIVLKLGDSRATYLPSVWEQLPLFDDFFISLCKKANLSANCLEKNPHIEIYQVEKYKEK